MAFLVDDEITKGRKKYIYISFLFLSLAHSHVHCLLCVYYDGTASIPMIHSMTIKCIERGSRVTLLQPQHYIVILGLIFLFNSFVCFTCWSLHWPEHRFVTLFWHWIWSTKTDELQTNEIAVVTSLHVLNIRNYAMRLCTSIYVIHQNANMST